MKTGSSEDFLAVLCPRAPGQPAARVTALTDAQALPASPPRVASLGEQPPRLSAERQRGLVGGPAALRVEHAAGADHVLLTPGAPAEVRDGEVTLRGEIAFARRGSGAALTLAVVQGEAASAAVGPWRLQSSGLVALAVRGNQVTGESAGPAHAAVVELPPDWPPVTVLIDEQPTAAQRDGRRLTIALPAGEHHWSLRR